MINLYQMGRYYGWNHRDTHFHFLPLNLATTNLAAKVSKSKILIIQDLK